VKVEPSGQRVFYYRYFWQGKRQFILLGRFPELSLAQARQQCKEHAGLLKEGKDPKAEIAEQLSLPNNNNVKTSSKAALSNSFWVTPPKCVKTVNAPGNRFCTGWKETYPFIPKATKARDVIPAHIKQILAPLLNEVPRLKQTVSALI
jgi:hypothetical protein